MHLSERSQVNCDAFILRRAAHILHKHSKKKHSFTLRVLMTSLIETAKGIEKREAENEGS